MWDLFRYFVGLVLSEGKCTCMYICMYPCMYAHVIYLREVMRIYVCACMCVCACVQLLTFIVYHLSGYIPAESFICCNHNLLFFCQCFYPFLTHTPTHILTWLCLYIYIYIYIYIARHTSLEMISQ